MEISPDTRTDSPAPAPAPQAPLDAAYCGPEPDFTETVPMFADVVYPR